ncbi:hypothetical protein AAE478_005436 [Parahypoxylon ruwenzoriense]
MPGTEPDAEPDGSPSRPRTPPRSVKAENHPPWSPRKDAATPKSTPPDSPSLILHSLGMSPFSPLRRQLSSPFVRSSSSLHPPGTAHSDQEEIVRDSKDVLVQRLNDLAAQLNKQDHINEDSVNHLHARVDEMEKVLSVKDHSSNRASRRPRSRPSSLALQNSRSEGDSFWGSLAPGRIIPNIPNISLPTSQRSPSMQSFKESTGAPEAKAVSEPRMSPAQASRIVTEAQKLCKELEAVVTSLRARQEESDHIHELLIIRAERAAQRIIHLEKRIKELESERNEGEMEMLNLQIQLKAIEVQCLSYVPENADEDLRESISTWKTEWAALKRKRARRKAAAGEDPGTPGTPNRQPRGTASPG